MSDIFDHEGDALECLISGRTADGEDDQRRITCRYCEQAGLLWKRVNGSWRLVDRWGVGHVCGVEPETYAQRMERQTGVAEMNDSDIEMTDTKQAAVDEMKAVIPNITGASPVNEER